MNKHILSISISAVLTVTPAFAQSTSAPTTAPDRGMTRESATPGLNTTGANTTGAGTGGIGDNTTGNTPNTTGPTGSVTSPGAATGVSRTTVGAGSDLSTATFQDRDSFSSQVESRLDRLDAQANTLSPAERTRFDNVRDSLRDELDRSGNISESEWQQYRNNITQDLESLENMTGSGTESQLIR